MTTTDAAVVSPVKVATEPNPDVGLTVHSVCMAEKPPLANLVTLGARDLNALRDFYGRLGWPQVIDDENFAVFELRGIVLALFPIAQLGHDGNVEPAPSTSGIRFTIGRKLLFSNINASPPDNARNLSRMCSTSETRTAPSFSSMTPLHTCRTGLHTARGSARRCPTRRRRLPGTGHHDRGVR
jgi:hypothetical protein